MSGQANYSMQSVAVDYTDEQFCMDEAYVIAHEMIFGDLGRHVAESAILFRDELMRPGFQLPAIRLAPVAEYGSRAGLSGNGSALHHANDLGNGVWVYLHRSWFEDRLHDLADEVVLHELLHNELKQFNEDPKHKSVAWARRCQEMSDRLGLAVRIERPRSRRIGGRVTTAVPDGCLPYQELVSWPGSLLKDGPNLRQRLLG